MKRPLKPLLALTVALLFVGCATVKQKPSATENDIRDVKAAFATLVEYQRTDDIRSLDLFTSNCVVTFTVMDGSAGRTIIWPPDAFRKLLREQLALKSGNKDTYEDVEYSEIGTNVLVTATIHYADSGKRGPFSALYKRDQGMYKIQELKVTMFAGGKPGVLQ